MFKDFRQAGPRLRPAVGLGAEDGDGEAQQHSGHGGVDAGRVDKGPGDHAKVGILAASVLAALLATAVLKTRNRQYREAEELEKVDADQDGIPDVYQDRN